MATGEGDKGGTNDAGDSGSNAGANDAGSNLSNEANSRESNPIGGSRAVRNETSSEEPNSEEPNGEVPNGEEPNGEEPNGEEPCEEEEETPPRPVVRRDNDNDYVWPPVVEIDDSDNFTRLSASGGANTQVRGSGGVTPPRAPDIVSSGGTSVPNPIYDTSMR